MIFADNKRTEREPILRRSRSELPSTMVDALKWASVSECPYHNSRPMCRQQRYTPTLFRHIRLQPTLSKLRHIT